MQSLSFSITKQLFLVVCMSVCGYACMSVDAGGVQKRALDPLELELQVIVSYSV